MLRNKLNGMGIRSTQCTGDADKTIVTTALDISKKVVVVAEDTDTCFGFCTPSIRY